MGRMHAAKITQARFSGCATRPYQPAMAAAQAARQASVITWNTRFMRGNWRSMSSSTRANANAAAVCRQTEKLCSRTAATGLSKVKLNGVERRPHLQADGTGGRVATFGRTLPAGEWHHVAFTFDHGKVKGYFDGAPTTLAGDPFSTTAPLGTDGYGLRLAKTPDETYHCKCALDDVRIYARTLAEAEISALAR